MNLTISRTALVAALRSLSGVISRRTAHPAVGKVFLRAQSHAWEGEGDNLLLSMTDFQVYATLALPIPGDFFLGEAIVDAERLLRFLSQDPADEVSLSIEEGRGDLAVTGRSTAKLATLPADSYAQHPAPPAEGWEALPAEPLLDALQRVSWASGTGRLRSPSTLSLRGSTWLLDAFAMRDGRACAGVVGTIARGTGAWVETLAISPEVADFLSSRCLDPGASIEVAVEPGRRTWWRGPGFQVAEQAIQDQPHPDYYKIFDEVGRKAPLMATLPENQAEELISGLHTLSGLGSWGLGSEDKRTDVLEVGFGALGITLGLKSDTVNGQFVLDQEGKTPLLRSAPWYTSFPGELVKALVMLLGGGDIEVRCHDGMHLFLFNERGGCASLSGRMP